MPDPAAIPAVPQIPDKLYFRIGEVSELLGLEPHVLRYWEGEFPSLSPKKAQSGHRLYRRRDVELLLQIKHLLYEKRFTIEGARQTLQLESRRGRPKPAVQGARAQRTLFADDPLTEIRRELAEILTILR
jgi:DNA-binding transcriptional MerR regulator